MLPIAAEIAGRLTRDHAQSALAGAPRRPELVERRRRALAGRVTVTVLRGLAVSSGALADRLDRRQAGHAVEASRT